MRVTLLYGIDNPIDEAVLRVLLRKAVSIHKTLGISVPLPIDSESVVETVVRSLFQEQVLQMDMFSGDPAVDVDELHLEWDRAAAREKGGEKAAAEEAEKEAARGGTAKPTPKPKAAKPQDSTFEKVVKSSTFQYAVKYAAREAVRGMFRVGRR